MSEHTPFREMIMRAWLDGFHADRAPARERRTDFGKFGCANRFEGEYPLFASAPDLLAALHQAAAGFAVISNQLGETHPGLADADNLESVRGFALENFHEARAAIARAKGEA